MEATLIIKQNRLKDYVTKPKNDNINSVKHLSDILKENNNFVLTNYSGLTVEKFTIFRQKLYKDGINYKVIKNNLFKIALNDKGITGLDKILVGPIAVLFAGEDIIKAAKIIKDTLKDVEIKVIGGFADGKVLKGTDILSYADLPSRSELYAQLLGTLQSPMRGFVNVLTGPLAGFCRVLKQISEKKDS